VSCLCVVRVSVMTCAFDVFRCIFRCFFVCFCLFFVFLVSLCMFLCLSDVFGCL